MFQRLFTSLALALSVTLASSQFTAAQERVHGFLFESQATVGTAWTSTRSTPLWPHPQDSGFAAILTVPRGSFMTAISGFKPTATGIYLRVTFNNAVGWIDERDIRLVTNTNPAPPPTNVASGISYFVANVNNWASLRQATSTQSARLARVPRGAVVVTTGQQVLAGGLTWLSVNFNGLNGWMPTRYLSQNNSAPANPGVAFPIGEYAIVNVNNWASMRAWASRSADRVTTVPRGQTVFYGGERRRAGGETWLQVSRGSFSGWMPVQYLRLRHRYQN